VRVLVTGGSGFIGVNIAEELTKKGIDIVLCDLNDLPKEVENALSNNQGSSVFCKADILDGNRLDEIIKEYSINMIIHAAVITPGEDREQKQSKLIAQVNYLGTVEVLETAKRNNIEKLVYLSSASVYGDAVDGVDLISEEDTFPRPREMYAITKFAAERTAIRYKEMFDMNIVVGRIGGVFGPWERYTGFRDTMSGPFFTTRAAILGEKIILSDAGVKDWVYSREIGKSVVALLLADKHKYDVYHLSSDFVWTVKDWCEKLIELYPNFEYEVLADPGVIERPPLKIERLKEDIGYFPKFDLDKSFEDYMNWVKNMSDFWIK
jgi:nucleoside-diphosphate-sugar epimerase